MKKIIKQVTRIPLILLAMALIFTALPFMTGELEAAAASKPAKVKSITANAFNGWVQVSWRSVKDVKGYAVFRDGKVVKRVKNAVYEDQKVESGKTYTYRVKAYRTSKQYYNSKTKKWVNKKPKASQWKGKKTRTKYIYGKASAAAKVTARKTSGSKSSSSGSKSSADSSSSAGSGNKSGGSSSGGSSGKTPPVTPPSDGGSEVYDDGYALGDTISMTDYKGNTVTYIKSTRQSLYFPESCWLRAGTTDRYVSLEDIRNKQVNPFYNREIDGTFSDGYTNYFQKDGVTFNADQLFSQEAKISDYPGNKRFEITMYNGDPNKLEYEIQNPTKIRNTYDYKQNPVTEKWIMNGDKYLSLYGEGTRINGNCTVKSFVFSWEKYPGDDLNGLTKGTVRLKVKYNGEYISDELSCAINTNAVYVGGSQYADYLAPARKEWLDIALAGVAKYGNGTYDGNISAIKKYVRENYSQMEIDCVYGMCILETYSVYAYGKTGFGSYGSYGNPYTRPSHYAFHLDENPAKYYEADGYNLI